MEIETIIKKSSKLRIWFIVSLIMRIINIFICFTITYLFMYELIDSTPSPQTLGFTAFLALEKTVIASTCIACFNKIISGNYKNLNEPLEQLHHIKWTCLIEIIFIAAMLLISLCAQWRSVAYAIGYTSLGSITFIVGSILTFCLIGDIKYEEKVKQYGSEAAYIDAMITEKENNDTAKQQRKYEQSLQKEYEKNGKATGGSRHKVFCKVLR